ncbi:hypothetical protein L6472_04215 [Prevotella sp. E13-17]|uniref:hypothetical protein n=1 Tax=Prevotella sp. E13-17 TaxID=2913616 RepID=UPI001EDABB9B|nr:hypothetical protein [Prevotella sp. E13-17]UKK51798.1 hypothetical protein L6472_04215 [Prevotella sp. E13-17]
MNTYRIYINQQNIMPTGKKAMLEVSKMKMTPALSAEHQRKWDESRWECKLDDPERNYNKSRAHLNFEVRKGGVIAPVDQSVCIKEKVDARIAEWKAERLAATGKEPIVRSTQHLSVSQMEIKVLGCCLYLESYILITFSLLFLLFCILLFSF